jgi:hypothetical protein
MKNMILPLFFLFFLNVYSQKNEIFIYDNAIDLIKESKEFTKYSTKNKAKNNKLKISTDIFSICEFYNFFSKNISVEIANYCETHDWANEKVITICELKKRSDKGEKSFKLSFTKTMGNYFIGKLKFMSNTNNSIIYLFEIKDGKAVLIDVGNFFQD